MSDFVRFTVFIALLVLGQACDSPVPLNGEKPLAEKATAKSKGKVVKHEVAPVDSTFNQLHSDSTTAGFANQEADSADLKAETAIDSLEIIDEEWADLIDEDFESDEDQGALYYSRGDLVLEKEKLLSTKVHDVIIPGYIDQRDSILAVIEERMRLDNIDVARKIVVEKWISPVNYKGYKFNRKKLILYGVRNEQPIVIYFYLENYYFAFDSRLYDLAESATNTAFHQIADTTLTNHLIGYENSL